MRFTSRPYFVSAALLAATAAYAGTEPNMGQDPARSDSGSRVVAAEQDSRAAKTDADRADAPAPAGSAEAAPAPQAAADAAAKPTATIAAPDPADPVLQRIWSGP